MTDLVPCPYCGTHRAVARDDRELMLRRARLGGEAIRALAMLRVRILALVGKRSPSGDFRGAIQ